jgi:hypothetical protein
MKNLSKEEQELYDYELDFQMNVNRLSKELATRLAEKKIIAVRDSEKKKPFKEMQLVG